MARIKTSKVLEKNMTLPATAHHGISIHLCSTSTRRFKITSGAAGGSATIAGSGGWEGHRLRAWHGDRAWPGWEWLRPWGWWGRGSETAFRLATVVASTSNRGVGLGPAWLTPVDTSLIL